MWRNLFALSIIIIFWTPFRVLADISCAPTQPLQQQNRTHMKHRIPAGTNPGVALTTAENMAAASPAAGVTVAGFRRADRPIDQRELQVVTLKGDLWAQRLRLSLGEQRRRKNGQRGPGNHGNTPGPRFRARPECFATRSAGCWHHSPGPNALT